MTKYVAVVGGGLSYGQPFADLGKVISIHPPGADVLAERIALLVFTGGADVSPDLYGELPCRLTQTNPHRDAQELTLFKWGLRYRLPMAGICRGAQFLCVMAGGKLYQHVTGHDYGSHDMEMADGRVVAVNSLHHQMVRPPESATLLGWAEPSRSRVYLGSRGVRLEPPDREAECVFYPNIRALGIQYHPEIMPVGTKGERLPAELVETWLLAVKEACL